MDNCILKIVILSIACNKVANFITSMIGGPPDLFITLSEILLELHLPIVSITALKFITQLIQNNRIINTNI